MKQPNNKIKALIQHTFGETSRDELGKGVFDSYAGVCADVIAEKYMNNYMTLEKFEAIPKQQVFACGFCYEPRLYQDRSSNVPTLLRWVAKKGEINDWALYYHHAHYDLNFIMRSGDKACTMEVIKTLVPCSDEVFARYRL